MESIKTKDKLVTKVINKLATRANIGIKKYGNTMEEANLTDAEILKMAQEECLDFAVYLEKILQKYDN